MRKPNASLSWPRALRTAMIGVAIALLAVAPPAAGGEGSASASADAKKVEATLIAPVSAIRAGQPFSIGLHQKIAPNWHTYWLNPGDSGEPIRLTWTLPDGFTASGISWPFPEAIPVGPLTNFGYSNDVLLPVTITPPPAISVATITIGVKAEWLVCEKICIPEEATLSLTLPVAPSGAGPVPPSPHADQFAAAARLQPIKTTWPLSARRGPDAVTLAIKSTDLEPARIASARFFPADWGLIENAAEQTVSWTSTGLTLTMKPAAAGNSQQKSLDGVLVLTETLADGGQAKSAVTIATEFTSPTLAPTQPPLTLLQAMVLAILGGLILNLMPCVLPILSIKVMAIAAHRDDENQQTATSAAARGGLAYLAGVLASFAVLAGILASVRSAGEALGWGFQFQSPVFVLALAALFLAMALSMSGVFDVGGRLVGAGQSLTRRSGYSGSFFTGVLATVAATPCTAPFMGAAIGYAMTRPAIELFAVLMALGIGFAMPVVALATWSGARRLLPRPGPWMETLKQALAFPLYATVAWLVWVLSIQSGSDGVLAASIVLVATGFAAWMIGRPSIGLPLRSAIALATGVAALAIALPQIGHENPPRATVVAPSVSASQSAVSDAQPFSIERVAELRSAGRPVFVNLTAAWCISCKVNEQVALSTDGFKRALVEHNVAYLKGDWTKRDDRISAVLKSYGRAGVPLYLLFPADPKAETIVLPQLLTEAIVTRHFAQVSAPPLRSP